MFKFQPRDQNGRFVQSWIVMSSIAQLTWTMYGVRTDGTPCKLETMAPTRDIAINDAEAMFPDVAIYHATVEASR